MSGTRHTSLHIHWLRRLYPHIAARTRIGPRRCIAPPHHSCHSCHRNHHLRRPYPRSQGCIRHIVQCRSHTLCLVRRSHRILRNRRLRKTYPHSPGHTTCRCRALRTPNRLGRSRTGRHIRHRRRSTRCIEVHNLSRLARVCSTTPQGRYRRNHRNHRSHSTCPCSLGYSSWGPQRLCSR